MSLSIVYTPLVMIKGYNNKTRSATDIYIYYYKIQKRINGSPFIWDEALMVGFIYVQLQFFV